MSRQQHIDKLEQQRLKLADDAQRLAVNGEQAARDTAGDARLTAARSREGLRSLGHDLTRDARGVFKTAGRETRYTAASNVKSAANKAASYPQRAVREKPALTFGAAAAVGFGVAVLFAARRRRASKEREFIIYEEPLSFGL